jgi:hypothetical protein
MHDQRIQAKKKLPASFAVYIYTLKFSLALHSSVPTVTGRAICDSCSLAVSCIFQDVVPAEIQELAVKLGLSAECALPKSRKQHQAIEKTARFVCKKGDKMEADLKVRFYAFVCEKSMCMYDRILLTHTHIHTHALSHTHMHTRFNQQ